MNVCLFATIPLITQIWGKKLSQSEIPYASSSSNINDPFSVNFNSSSYYNCGQTFFFILN